MFKCRDFVSVGRGRFIFVCRFVFCGNVIAISYEVVNLPVPDLPAEDPWVLSFVFFYSPLDVRGSHSWLAPADHARPDAPRLLVSVEDLGDAAMRHPQLTRDDARADSRCCHLDYLESYVVWKRSAVDEHPT